MMKTLSEIRWFNALEILMDEYGIEDFLYYRIHTKPSKFPQLCSKLKELGSMFKTDFLGMCEIEGINSYYRSVGVIAVASRANREAMLTVLGNLEDDYTA